MSFQFQVVLDDLLDLSHSFEKEADEFGKLRSRISPGPVDGGDADLNQAIQVVMDMLNVFSSAATDKLRSHADGLRECHDDYHANDADVEQLFNKMMED